jgi:hypothetical protein
MTNKIFVIEVYYFYDQAKWSQNWSQKGMPRGTANAGCWRGKAHADMDMMTWLFDTAPCVVLRFVHVSSSKWSTCRTQVCPCVALQFVHVSRFEWSTCRTQVCPRVALWFVHVSRSGCSTFPSLVGPCGKWWRQSHGKWHNNHMANDMAVTWEMMTSVTWLLRCTYFSFMDH